MQQQPVHPMGPMGSGPPATITTEQIQKYLDENKQLILAILDNQNLGRLAECAQYQAQLQKNLLYLAAIADAQPQAPAMRPQMIPHAAMPQAGGQYMQQASIFPPKTSLQFTPQQVQELQQQQQQQQLHHHPQMMPFQGHMVMRPVGPLNEIHAAPQTQSSHGGGGSSGNEPPSGGTGMSEPQRGNTLSSTADVRGSKSDAGSAASKHAAAAAAADGQKNLASEQGNGDAEAGPNPKRLESSKTP